MAAGPEADQLGRVRRIGLPGVVVALEPRDVNQELGRGWFPGERVHACPGGSSEETGHEETGHIV
jgi:hypothetical protein